MKLPNLYEPSLYSFFNWPWADVYLSKPRIHVDGSLAVFNGSVVVVQLGESGGAVAVVDLVGVVNLDGSENT